METKTCSGCGRELPLSEFNKNRRNRDGLQGRCRECYSAYNRRRYESDGDRIRRKVTEYRRDNPGNVLETCVATCARKPTRRNAYLAVRAALEAGVLTRPDVCSGCGCGPSEHRIEAHHHDYGRPLDVIWLCTPCHRRMDIQRRAREGARERSGS